MEKDALSLYFHIYVEVEHFIHDDCRIKSRYGIIWEVYRWR